jgi:hypothetical protein
MTDVQRFLASIRRPRLLIRAARFGLLDYRRDRDLRRVLGTARIPSPAQALSTLAEAEETLEMTRQMGDAAYSVTRHVELLIALMGEARALRDPT